MKHIDIGTEYYSGLSKRMVTQESNNFGDQILTLKELIIANNKCYYVIISITSKCEGDWMSLEEMRNWSNNVKTTKEIYEPRIK
mgnify:CR=1 FL=1